MCHCVTVTVNFMALDPLNYPVPVTIIVSLSLFFVTPTGLKPRKISHFLAPLMPCIMHTDLDKTKLVVDGQPAALSSPGFGTRGTPGLC